MPNRHAPHGFYCSLLLAELERYARSVIQIDPEHVSEPGGKRLAINPEQPQPVFRKDEAIAAKDESLATNILYFALRAFIHEPGNDRMESVQEWRELTTKQRVPRRL